MSIIKAGIRNGHSALALERGLLDSATDKQWCCEQAIDSELNELQRRKDKMLKLIELRNEVEELEKGNVTLQCNIVMGLIMEEVSKTFNVSYSMITGPGRDELIVVPRHIICYLARTMTALSFEKIGKIINRDHGSIINGCESTKDRMSVDDKFKAMVAGIKARCLAKISENDKNIKGNESVIGH